MALTGLMTFALLGIIWVQLVWIRQAVKVRNEQFDRSVARSLNNVVESLERRSDQQILLKTQKQDSLFFEELNRSLFPGSPVTGVPADVAPGAAGSISYYFEGTSRQQSRRNGGTLSEKQYYYEKGRFTFPNRPESYPLHSPEGRSRDSLSEEQRRKYMERISEKKARLEAIGNQMMREIYEWEKEQRFDNIGVREQLEEVFSNAQLNTPFQYGIIQNGKIREGSFIDTAAIYTSPYQVKLFPGDIFTRDLRLSVLFPERKNYILKSMGLLLGGSAVFSLVILVTFGLSIWFIVRQKRISEMKSDFINNMTHEFKTPIATISLASDSLLNERVIMNKDQIRYFTGMIQKENQRMNKQVESILQIARLDKKDLQVQFQQSDIHELIEKAIQSVKIQVENRGGEIRAELKAENAVLSADPMHVTNMVYNLLDNANKYSPGTPGIAVRTKNAPGGVVLSVEDNGMGMSRQVQSRIFERFYRQTSGNVHNVKGFGLGLNYVGAIVEAHRGWIKVQSELGKGSVFTVFLPFTPDN